MQPFEAQCYCNLMSEIKVRSRLIRQTEQGGTPVLPPAARVEFVYLQLRKMIELIAMGSLVANADMFAQMHSNIQKYWNAKDLLRDNHAINPEFYPRPIIQRSSQWVDRPEDFLTKDRFVTLCNICGSVLHAPNPFAEEQDLARLSQAQATWHSRIVNLLDAHVVRLVGDTTLSLIQMGNEAQAPTCSLWQQRDARPGPLT